MLTPPVPQAEQPGTAAATHINLAATLLALRQHRSSLEHAQAAVVLLQAEIFQQVNLPLGQQMAAAAAALRPAVAGSGLLAEGAQATPAEVAEFGRAALMLRERQVIRAI